MTDLSDLEKRVLTAALIADGRVIFWVLGNGRWLILGFPEDVKVGVQGLETRGLLVPRDAAGRITGPSPARSPGSYIVQLTEAGKQAARKVVGHAA